MKPFVPAILALLLVLPAAAQQTTPPNVSVSRAAVANSVAATATAQVQISGMHSSCLSREFGSLTFNTSQGPIKISFGCFPYTCDATTKTCSTGCATNGDCSGGFACVSSKCVVPVPQCNADFTASVTPFGKSDVCYPLVCNQSTGLCQQRCRTSADCQAGFACNITPGTCEKP